MTDEIQMPPVCAGHQWEPYPGPDYDFRINRQMHPEPLAYVRCPNCGADVDQAR
jgi:hypothetical protein